MTAWNWPAGVTILKWTKPMSSTARKNWRFLGKYGLEVYSISTHLVGQAVSDRIDERHKGILPDYVWGDGDPEGVNQRAAAEIIKTGEAAKGWACRW